MEMSMPDTPMPSATTQMALSDTTNHELTSILERPVNLGTFEWSSTDEQIPILQPYSVYTQGGYQPLNKWDFPQAILEFSSNVVEKLSRFQYLKADLEVEIKVNAQPFLQGALMLSYSPYYEQTNFFRSRASRFMASQTSLPHKILSLEEGNTLKITCPYANIYDLFDLSNPDNQFGTIFLDVFSSLRGAETSSTCKYTVFARFINPQYYTPTHRDTMSEIKDAHQLNRLRARGILDESDGTPNFPRPRGRTLRDLYAQSAVSPVAASDTGEVTSSGPISKIATGVAMVSDVLATVPIIGSVASTVAWVSRAVRNTAASFGLSKPVRIVDISQVVSKPNATLIHTEGADEATTLALLQDNGIDGSSFIPEYRDEMALSYVLSRPNVYHAQDATSVIFSGRKLITAWEVSPLSQYQFGEVEDSKTMYLGSFAYTCQSATLWRGSIIYTIRMIKTQYHQGRFAVVFLPETNLADVPQELGDLLTTNYNVVCDLKDRDTEVGRSMIEFPVPFVANTPWRECYKQDNNESNPGPDSTTLETKTGCVAIYSVNDLSSPPTVSPAITFYIAHAGGPDFQIARPQFNIVPGFQSLYAQSDTGPVVVPDDSEVLLPVGKQIDVTAQTTGEYYHSLRALMKRFGKLTDLEQSEEFTGLLTRSFNEEPTTGKRVFSRNQLDNFVLPTPWYMISFLYRFYNGSSMLKLLPYTPGVVGEAYLRYDEDKTQQITLPESDSYTKPLFRQLQQISNAFELRTPFYRGIRCDVVGSTATPVLNDVRTCLRMRNLANYGGASQVAPLFEAAGDDFNFFYLVGPPPVCDARNLKTFQTMPSGTQQTFTNTGTYTVGVEDGVEILKISGNFAPSIPDSNLFYPVSTADQTVTVVYKSGASLIYSLVGGWAANRPSVSPGLYIPVNDINDVDLVATATANSWITATLVTGYPYGSEKISGVERVLSFDSLSIFQSGTGIGFAGVSTTPALLPNQITAITSSSPASFTITFTDATQEIIAVTDCQLKLTGGTLTLEFLASVTTPIDEPATKADLDGDMFTVVTLT